MTEQRTIIFDLDGTLVDSAPDIHATANAALTAHGLPALGFAEVKRMIGRGVPPLIADLLTAAGADPDGPLKTPVTDSFLALYEDANALSRLYPGVRETLDALAADGYRLGLCTNKPMQPTRAVLAHFGIAEVFAAVVGGDSLPLRKPDPAPLLHARDLLGGGSVLYVGDSETDAETARRAGLPFALFTEGYRKSPVEALPHHAAFDDYAALPAIAAGCFAAT